MIVFLKPGKAKAKVPQDKILPTYFKLRTWSLSGAFIGYMGYYLVRNNITLSTPFIQHSLELSKSDIGTITGSMLVAYGISKGIASALSDKADPKRYMALGLILCAIVNVALGFCNSFFAYVGFCIALGLFQGMGVGPSFITLAKWYPKKERGIYTAIWNISHNIGGGIVAPIITFSGFGLAIFLGVQSAEFNEKYWHINHFYVPATCAIVISLYVLYALKGSPQNEGLPDVDEINKMRGAGAESGVKDSKDSKDSKYKNLAPTQNLDSKTQDSKNQDSKDLPNSINIDSKNLVSKNLVSKISQDSKNTESKTTDSNFIESKPPKDSINPAHSNCLKSHTHESQSTPLSSPQIFYRYVFKNKNAWYVALIDTFVYMVRFGIISWIPIYLLDTKGFTKEQMSVAFLLFEWAAIPSTLFAGYISDKLFRGLRMPPAIISMAVIFFMIVGYFVSDNLYAVIFFATMAGCLIYIPQFLASVQTMEVVPSFAVGSCVGLRGFMSYVVGATLGTKAIGFMVDYYHTWDAGLFMLLGACVACIIFASLCHFSVKKSQ